MQARCATKFLAFLTAAGAGTCISPGLVRADEPPVEVMILATMHMGNPGRDVHSTTVPDVLLPQYQRQINQITDALARFRPTQVHVEAPAEWAPEAYANYLADKSPPSRSETEQIGFRLAKAAGATVRGIDVEIGLPLPQVQAWAAAHGQQARLDAMNATIEGWAKDDEDSLKTRGIPFVYRRMNDPAQITNEHAATYRSMVHFGEGREQPGAELLATWYWRNAVICAQMIQSSRPGDRVVVIFGGGHAFFLRQCVSEMPGFKLVEANDYLPK
jgi:hypothetical protein